MLEQIKKNVRGITDVFSETVGVNFLNSQTNKQLLGSG